CARGASRGPRADARAHPGVGRPREGAQAPRLPLHRPDDGLRSDAGVRPGRRPRRDVPGGQARRLSLTLLFSETSLSEMRTVQPSIAGLLRSDAQGKILATVL